MPRVCTVCTHPERHEIERLLVNRFSSYRTIASQYSLTQAAVGRHVRSGHIAELLAKAHQAKEWAAADELLMDIRKLQARTLLTLANAERSGDLRTVLAAVSQARQNIALLAEMRGELDRSPTLNLYVNPEWQALKALLVEVLGAYPDARAAVVRAIQEREEQRALEAGNGQHG